MSNSTTGADPVARPTAWTNVLVNLESCNSVEVVATVAVEALTKFPQADRQDF